MNPETFSVLRELAMLHTGQKLEPGKSALFASRLKNFAYKTGYSDPGDLTREIGIQQPGSNINLQLATALLDRRSRFVPERGLFADLCEDHLLPALSHEGDAKFRIWFAGCGSGQEAYSLLMMLKNRLAPEDMARIDIVATDIASDALMKASIGVYSHFEVQIGLSAHNLVRYFTQSDEKRWRIASDLTRKIAFNTHNLLEDDAHLGAFDLVVCRNVLNAMTDAHRTQAERNLERHVRPGGHLLIEP